MPKNLQILSLVAFLHQCSCTLQINVKFKMIIIDFISAPSFNKTYYFHQNYFISNRFVKKQCDDDNTSCNNFDKF